MQNIKVAGIVTEYNPFHKGHEWMIEQLRQRGYGAVVCVMSGPFVQRAEPAILPTWVRAKAALVAGADLVLRLPVPYATASAEPFAMGGVGILAALGCVDVLAFGAECDDTEQLWQVAQTLQTEEFYALLREELKQGVSFAVARARAVEKMLPGATHAVSSPNNILGIEYCKAIQSNIKGELQKRDFSKELQPVALQRKGAGHDGAPAEEIASASWLRKKAWNNESGVQEWKGWVPEICLPIYQNAEREGDILDGSRWELALLARLKGCAASDFAPYCGKADEGLAERMAVAAQDAVCLQELYAGAKSKRFAHSRVRRAALATAMQLPLQLSALPPFIQVLAANKIGMAVLKKAKTTSCLPVSTSLAKLQNSSAVAQVVATTEAKAEDMYSFCKMKAAPGGTAYTKQAIINK